MRAARTLAGLALVAGVASTGCSGAITGTAAPAPATAAPATAAPATSAAAPAADPAVALAARFVDQQGRFGISPPRQWTVDTSGVSKTAAVFLDTRPTGTGKQFTANINVLLVPSAAQLPETVVGARSELRSLDAYRSTTDEPVPLQDGTAAHLLGGTFTDSASGLALRNLQLFAVHDGRTIVVTGTALAQTWDTFGPVFAASLRTVVVTP